MTAISCDHCGEWIDESNHHRWPGLLPPVDLVGADLAGTSRVVERPAEVRPDHDVYAANRGALEGLVVMHRMTDSCRLHCVAVLDCTFCPEAVVHSVHVASSADLTAVVRTAATFGLLAWI